MKKLIAALVKTQTAVGSLLLGVFFITIVIQIFCRYAGIAVLWTEEVSVYSFIWAVFMGASVMVYYRQHFSFTFLQEKIKGRGGKLYSAGLSAIMLAFTAAMTYYSADIVDMFWYYNWISIPEMQMGYVWLCLPVMGVTMSIYSLNNMISDLLAMNGEAEQ